MVEMGDARGLCHHLEHVVGAEGVERVATIVRGDGDLDAFSLELMEQRHAAPARRAAGVAALQIHVTHRQADDGNASVSDGRQSLAHEFVVLDGQGTAMTALQSTLETQAHGGTRDFDQGAGAAVAALVDMQVEIKTALHGEAKDMLEETGE